MNNHSALENSEFRNPKSEIIRVLVIDDSSFMRKSLTHILESEDSIEVVGTAADGEKGVQCVKEFRPDVVLMDIEMPVMDGLTALAYVMAECPTPVLMLSALNKRDADIAVKSLHHGAVDFIAKPSGVISYDIDRLRDEILTKVKTAARANVSALDLRLPPQSYLRPGARPEKRKKIVVIGASTGGPKALDTILAGLPRDISAAIVVIQHMGTEFISSFVERLQWLTSLRISLAQKDEIIHSGRVLIGPGDRNTMILRDGKSKKIGFSREPSVSGTSTIDYTMESAARAYGEECVGVLLTGLGSDGTQGMKAIRDAGGSTIAEDQSTCVVFGMPKAAIEMGCVDEVVPLDRIAGAILRRI